MNKYIELGRKLKALADAGIGGEKLNAERLLNELLKKHNLTIEEIEGEKLQDFFFNITKEDWRLWYQIVKKVNYTIKCYGEFPKKLMRENGLKGNYMITTTVSEFVEIEAKNDFFKKLLKSELEVFVSAFIEANDLGVDNPNPECENKIYKKEYEELLRVQELASKIKKGNFHKQLVAPK